MGQIPDLPVRFFYTVGRTFYDDDAMESVGPVGVGWWALFNALACEHDGTFRIKTAFTRFSEYGEVGDGLDMLLDAKLLMPIVDDAGADTGWLSVVGWHKWQKAMPKSNAERQREWRERQKQDGSVTDVTERNNGNAKKTRRDESETRRDDTTGADGGPGIEEARQVLARVMEGIKK